MLLHVLKPIKLKKAGRLFDVSPGAIVEISKPEKAQELIQSGHIRPILPPDETGKPYAVKIFSHILQDEVWVITGPEAIAFVPEGACVYLPEEINMMQGADAHTMRLIHEFKKGMGAILMTATEGEKNA